MSNLVILYILHKRYYNMNPEDGDKLVRHAVSTDESSGVVIEKIVVRIKDLKEEVTSAMFYICCLDQLGIANIKDAKFQIFSGASKGTLFADCTLDGVPSSAVVVMGCLTKHVGGWKFGYQPVLENQAVGPIMQSVVEEDVEEEAASFPEAPAAPTSPSPEKEDDGKEKVLVERNGKFVMVAASELELSLMDMPKEEEPAHDAVAAADTQVKKERAQSAKGPKTIKPKPPSKARAQSAKARAPKGFTSEDGAAAFDGWYQRKKEMLRKAKKEAARKKAEEEATSAGSGSSKEELAAMFEAWKRRKDEEKREKLREERRAHEQLMTIIKTREASSDSDEAFKQWKKRKAVQKQHFVKTEKKVEKHLSATASMSVEQIGQLNTQAVNEWMRQKKRQQKSERAQTRSLVRKHTQEARRISESLRRVYSPGDSGQTRQRPASAAPWNASTLSRDRPKSGIYRPSSAADMLESSGSRRVQSAPVSRAPQGLQPDPWRMGKHIPRLLRSIRLLLFQVPH